MAILSHLSTVAGRWRVVKLLGSGGFGDVYKVQKVDNPDKTESAMKTEMVIGNRQMLRLKIEVVVLMKCHEQPDPERKAHFFLVMGLVGPSLEDIRKKDLVRNFSKSTAMQCCIQTMTAVRDLHGIGYLHRDIKPQNYAIGLGPKETTIYMLDFGIARKYTEGETKVVKVPRIKVHFLGTLRFASRACHKQIEQGRKDDLECWLYMVSSSCYRIVPEDFKRLVQYIDGLKYADEPDYVYSDETSTDNKQEETGSGEKEEDSKARSRFVSVTSFMSDTVIVDIKMVDDKARALEVLRNLAAYRHLETLHLQGCTLTDEELAQVREVNRDVNGTTLHLQGCTLTDEELAQVREVNRDVNGTVKYLCLRDNRLSDPWQTLAEMFTQIVVLDCRGNRFLTLRPILKQGEEEPKLLTVRELFVDPWVVAHATATSLLVDNDPDVIQKLCPAATQLNYHAISRGGTKVDKRSNSGSEDQLLTAGSSEEERREGEEIDDARHDKELDIGWDGELTDESNDEDDYD
ncbi:unnamed protein product [Nippostrongylus brasiliensis]|uniref:Protein kinase domain-containing protein n=1 Tax=Nippostrongylus brasiliensis TaxID=27835 RepID=A0A158QY32_NIPBR|nr:unnamed protein product [Nippostrongylus brasiliensis]